MACLGCGRGFHEECDSNCIDCHGETDRLVKTFIGGRGVGQPIKDPENVKDRHSTGRKRAAHLYPIFKDKPCEWQGKKNCGGGTPIIGCIDRLQVDRHHGPVKDTLRNEPGNVHRICKSCHNRWHAVNDPIYDEELYNTLPHKPEPAEEMELLANEAYWRLKK
jgi:hypothetical protein